MTVWEYAIAREASRLMREQEKRELTREEAKLLHLLAPTLERYQREEESRIAARGARKETHAG